MPTQSSIDIYILSPSDVRLSSAGVSADRSACRLFTLDFSSPSRVTRKMTRTLDDAVYVLASVRHNDVAGN